MQIESRPRGMQLVAVLVVPALCVLLLPAAAAVDATAPGTGPGADIADGPGWPWVVNGALLGVFAAVVLVRDRRQRFGWVLAASGLFWSLDGFAQSYVHAGLSADGAWPGMTFVLWFLNRFGAYLTSVTAALLLVFPTGRFLPGRWTPASWIAVAGLFLSGLAVIVAPAEGDQWLDDVPAGVDQDPTSITALAGHGQDLVSAGVAVGVAAFFFSLLTVVVRYRRSEGLERDRMRWLLWSVFVIVAVLLVSLMFPLPGDGYAGAFSATVLPPAAMTIAIVRPTLVSIQDLLARTAVLAAVLAVLVVADAAVLALLTLVLDDELSQAQVVAVVLAVAVVLYGPLRQRLSALVRRLMLGERTNRYDVVAGLASTLETTDDSTEQLTAVARAVAAAFGIAFVSVEVERSHGERLVTTVGELAGPGGGRGLADEVAEQLLVALAQLAAQSTGGQDEAADRGVAVGDRQRADLVRALADGGDQALAVAALDLHADVRDPERAGDRPRHGSQLLGAVVGGLQGRGEAGHDVVPVRALAEHE
ncbi:MAG TPA: hypothetical protein VM575_10120, partial [Nocardioides sp.]|nr:hypothetical protein [Nocardioides sp.]